MPIPTFVGAGAGAAITALQGNVEKTNCTAGNFIVVHSLQAGTSGNQSFINDSNVQSLDGVADSTTALVTGAVGGPTEALYDIWLGRVTADGTVSGTMDSSGDDMYARIYEFSGVSQGTTLATVIEETTPGSFNFGSGTSTTIADESVTTLDIRRLAVSFITVNSNQSIAAFTGETGGDWIKPVSEFASGVGTGGAICLQQADMNTADTIDGGTITITSEGWAVLAFALIPATTSDIPPVAWLRA